VPSEGHENFGLIGLEAMARGRPCIGSKLGGIPDWLEDGAFGLLLPPRDPDAWAAGIVASFEDMSKLNRWGEAARKRYRERFHPSIHVASLLALYGEVLQKAGKHPVAR